MNNPLCAECAKEGLWPSAAAADNDSDFTVFWDPETGWKPLCKMHHDIWSRE